MNSLRPLATALGLALSTSATRARAESAAPATFRLRYEASDARCPNAPAFLAGIRARTDRPRLAAPGEPAIAVDVRLAGAGTGAVHGALVIRAVDGRIQMREVEGESCADVAGALALVTALYLDPDAGERDPSPSPVPGRAAPARASAPPPSARTAPVERTRALVDAALVVRGGVGPSLAPGAAAGVAVELGPRLGPAWWRPSLRIGAEATTTSAEVAVGAQRYVLGVASVRACPVRVGWRRLHASPCAGLELGVHEGGASGVPGGGARSAFWLASTGALALGLDVAPHVALGLVAGVVAPARRTRFFLAPDATLYRTPSAAATVALGVTIGF